MNAKEENSLAGKQAVLPNRNGTRYSVDVSAADYQLGESGG